jgi:predicted chitinase
MKYENVQKIEHPISIYDLNEIQLSEIQSALSLLNYPVGAIDGLIGPRTKNAIAEFITDNCDGEADVVDVNVITTLISQVDSDANCSKSLTTDSTKYDVIKAIIAECKRQGIVSINQIAYVLATAQHETGDTFQPVREAYWKSEEWRKSKFRYYPYYGRGLVQLTWKNNYEKYSKILGVDLVNNPDLAMNPNVSLFIIVHGFKTGTWTGRKITDYINNNKTDFINARRIVNGRDKAVHIANLAKSFISQISI